MATKLLGRFLKLYPAGNTEITRTICHGLAPTDLLLTALGNGLIYIEKIVHNLFIAIIF